MYRNHNHRSLQDIKDLYHRHIDSMEDFQTQLFSPVAQQLETVLAQSNNATFKMIHPLSIEYYRSPKPKFNDRPVKLIGLDIETDATTGHPILLGLWHPETASYDYIYKPTIQRFFEVLYDIVDNTKNNFIVWGNLDIQCLLRLFNPSEYEREAISKGLSANIKRGEIIADPPIFRTVYERGREAIFYVSHYIPGRSLKLGYILNGRERTVWVFNASQFYPGTISQSAKGLHLKWIDFDKSTHIIDWSKFEISTHYKRLVFESNKQDARIVTELSESLQARFYEVFDCYPSLLVSTGSLTDAVVGKLLSPVPDDYNCNSWEWLKYNVWNTIDAGTIAACETLLAEAFSAGYVDQFSMGYFDTVYTADIAAAYPDKIRALPDLRYSTLIRGSGDLDAKLKSCRAIGLEVETAFIRGKVTIPTLLKYHPITIKTYGRDNYRPTGTFHAAYTLEEREFCMRFGAKFDKEQYVILALFERRVAPIAAVSERLGKLRVDILTEYAATLETNRKILLDGQQYLVKVIDNSIYGKTVMTTEVVQNVGGVPQVTGYLAGDRFNLIYGTLITARTRIQIAEACNAITSCNGTPIMTMTDSVYWEGTPDCLPNHLIRQVKTPGYFESVQSVHQFFLLKTGQYEFCMGGKWHYKMRGLNPDREELDGSKSFYRDLISTYSSNLPNNTSAVDVIIPINTRRLITVGSHDTTKLGLIEEGITELKPFVMSSKQVERYIENWMDALNRPIWLKTPHISNTSVDKSSQDYPLSFLRTTYERAVEYSTSLSIHKSTSRSVKSSRIYDHNKRTYILHAARITKLPPPCNRPYRLSWDELINYYKVRRNV